MEYNNNSKSLTLIHNDKGVVNVSGATYTYEYFIKDHLGNVRATFQPNGASPTVTQTTNYYPFGAISESNWGSSNNKYTFNRF